MSVIAAPFTRTLSRKLLVPWWLFLLSGIGWMLVALIVLRFDYKSVNAIAILFGAAGYYARSAILLVAWVAAFAIIRGAMDIVLAFRVQALQHASASA